MDPILKIEYGSECALKIKRKFYLAVQKNPLTKNLTSVLIKVNCVLFHWDERRIELHNGLEEPSKTYYVIRSRGRQEGLLSTYYYVLKAMNYAYNMGYIPVVDFSTDLCQYHVHYPVNSTNNAWEYYFRQPISLNAFNQEDKCNVILSGWSFGSKENDSIIDEDWKRNFFDKICPIQPYIMDAAQKKYEELFNVSRGGVLGVFCRGTDHVNLKPKGHNVQPTVAMLLQKIESFLKDYDIDKIYVVTEDYSIYSAIRNHYGECVFSADDNFVRDYDKGDYLESSLKNDAYIRGRNYLIRLILLTRCDYLITSLASGSKFAMDLKTDKYKAQYVFDLGRYE